MMTSQLPQMISITSFISPSIKPIITKLGSMEDQHAQVLASI